MQLQPAYWPGFPYQALARVYDVFLPMAYFTYRARGSSAARGYVAASIAAVRAEVGNAAVPIHVIGGLTERIGAAEARGFMQAVAACAPLGYSLYEFPTTRPVAWSQLAVPPTAAPGANAGCSDR